MTSDSERIAVAQELAQCVSAAFRALKALAPDAHPWAGNMLGTEHLQKLGTTVFLTLNRWGIDPPAGAGPHSASAPAVPQNAPDAKEDGDAAREAREQSTASAGPKRGDPVDGWTFGDSRHRNGKLEWYAGECVNKGHVAWVRFEPDVEQEKSGQIECTRCWAKRQGRKR